MPWNPPQRPRWVERLNAHAVALGGAHHLVSLDPLELLQTARQATGLSDFGDPGWREHYDVLLPALEDESRLHLLGRTLVRNDLLRTLQNRLRLVDLWKNRPAILDDALPDPVFVVGSPRSGTSILFELLACDPANRAPGMWEMLHPVEALDNEAMLPLADDTMQFWHDVQPEYETMHANSGELPNECIYITLHEFLSDQWSGCHVVPSYDAHLTVSDHRPAYRLHRRFLQTLQQRRRGARWLLKAPSHLSQLRALFDVYPNARIVHTHRDPLETIPSAISLMGTLKWMRCEGVDMGATAAQLPWAYAYLYERQMSERGDGTLPDDQFIDVRYPDLVSDPVGVVRGVYARLGWEFSTELAQRVADYIANKPRGKHGVHRYSAEEMGLDPAKERDRFRFYMERFDLTEED